MLCSAVPFAAGNDAWFQKKRPRETCVLLTPHFSARLCAGTAYTASKFAMNALGSAMAAEYREQGIRVTNLCPGEVLTPIMKL